MPEANAPPSAEQQQHFLRRAIKLAQNGLGRTSPNPLVGCVIATDNTVTAEGWHNQYGGLHAEAMALAQAGTGLPDNTTMYVTLEPCNHQGKQPPCTNAIIASGIRRVVVGMRDPNPCVAGGGIERLQGAGVDVLMATGAVMDEAQWLVRAWTFAITHSRPYLVLKVAQSLDGHMATSTGERRELTSAATRAHVHGLRAWADGVMVGMGTVLADDPHLDVRDAEGRNPARIVVGSPAELPFDGHLYRTRTDLPTHLLNCELNDAAVPAFIEDLKRLYAEQGIVSILCEGGPNLASWLLNHNLIQELHLHIAPIILGSGRGMRLPEGRWTLRDAQHIGADVIMTLLPTTT
jgi:diaminohydroxyphosphoribosylaminopyrimidine deaminase/5-amino-6-(5-phosphoribosylamino)uracil reductase